LAYLSASCWRRDWIHGTEQSRGSSNYFAVYRADVNASARSLVDRDRNTPYGRKQEIQEHGNQV